MIPVAQMSANHKMTGVNMDDGIYDFSPYIREKYNTLDDTMWNHELKVNYKNISNHNKS